MKKILILNLFFAMAIISSCDSKKVSEEKEDVKLDINSEEYRVLTDVEYDEWVTQNPEEYTLTSGESGLLCSFENGDYAQIDIITISGKIDVWVYDEDENVVFEKYNLQTGSFTIKSEDIKNYPSPKNSYKVIISKDNHKGEYNFENISNW